MSGVFGGGDIDVSSPKLAGVRVQTSAYGACIPIVYGRTRITCNILQVDDFKAEKQKQDSGKGGGGEVTTGYKYTCSAILGLCEGPIDSVQMIWKGKSKFPPSDWHFDRFALRNGSYSQDAHGFWASRHPSTALAYRGQAYVTNREYWLDSNAGFFNNHFEIIGRLPYGGGIDDALPTAVATDLLTNAYYGANFTSPFATLLGDWSQWETYCIASGIFISPAYTSQKELREMLNTIARLTNTELFYSEGKLKAVPYGDESITGNGVTYTPNTTPIYDLTIDDFLSTQGDAPVRFMRNTSADAYNQVQVKFYNRANEYAEDVAEAKDQANIEQFGLRPMQPIEMYEICDAAIARRCAELIKQRVLYVRNTYEFRLGWKYSLLEPMDIVTLTVPNLGLDYFPVRITRIEEDEDGKFIVSAEEYLGGIASSPLYPHEGSSGYAADFNAAPGDANPPVIFEAPQSLASSALELWVLASGGEAWGGCEVWISSDDVSYVNVGRIESAARQGELTATLGVGADPDVSNALSVDMSMSGLQLLSGSQSDVDLLNTLCYVGGEFIAYRDADLVSANTYDLTYLRRGVYGSEIASHGVGSQFVRVDRTNVARYVFDEGHIGSTVYIKLVSFNVWNGGLQDIAEVPVYSHTITGSALSSPPDDVANLHTNHRASLLYLYWDEVTDFRSVDYEVRTGPTWGEATVLGRVAQPGYPLPGNGVFWVAARALGPNGMSVYSEAPVQITVSGAAIVKNVIAEFDEVATGWTGTLSGGAVISGGTTLQLDYAGDFADIVDLGDATEVPDLGAYGSVVSSGIYTAPVAHRVTLADVAECLVQISFEAAAFITGVGVVADPGIEVDVVPQIRRSQDGGATWGAWEDYKPGVYVFSALDWRVLLASRNDAVTPLVTGLTIAVDVPDLVQSGSVVTSTTSTVTHTFAKPFNGGNDASNLPVVQITIVNAQAGDVVRITNKSLTDFDVDVVNAAGVRQARTLDITAQGY